MATGDPRKELFHLSKSELVKKCKKAKLATNGTKDDLVNRLIKQNNIVNKSKTNSNKKKKTKAVIPGILDGKPLEFKTTMSTSPTTTTCCYNTNHKIAFLNQAQFQKQRDDFNQEIYYYIANDIGLKSNDRDKMYRLIYGKYVRIYCANCSYSTNRFPGVGSLTPSVQKCKFNRYPAIKPKSREKSLALCSNKEMMGAPGSIQGFGEDETDPGKYTICLNHPLCSKCNRRTAYSLKKCKKCKYLFCKVNKCYNLKGKLCCDCTIKKEYNNMVVGIKKGIKLLNLSHLFEINIIKILAQYSIGVGLKCCNKNDECQNIIICNSLYEFELKIDNKSQTIYYYKPKYFYQQLRPTVLVSGYLFRVFCAQCTKTKIKGCTFQLGLNGVCTPLGIKEPRSVGVCGYHPFCEVCKTQKVGSYLGDLPKCIKCKKYFCKKHILMNQCEDCMNKIEFRNIRRNIQLSLKVIDFKNERAIIVIAEFCVGVVAKCWNNKSICKSNQRGLEIVINNQYQFDKCKDYKGNTIRHSAVDGGQISDDYYYYGKYRKIFCSLCRYRRK